MRTWAWSSRSQINAEYSGVYIIISAQGRASQSGCCGLQAGQPPLCGLGQGDSYPKKHGVRILRLFREYNIDRHTHVHTWTCTHTVYLSESGLFRRITLSFVQRQLIRDLNYTYKVLSSSQWNVKPYCHILSVNQVTSFTHAQGRVEIVMTILDFFPSLWWSKKQNLHVTFYFRHTYLCSRENRTPNIKKEGKTWYSSEFLRLWWLRPVLRPSWHGNMRQRLLTYLLVERRRERERDQELDMSFRSMSPITYFFL